MEPATSAANDAVTTALFDAPATIRPIARLEIDTMPSFAPSTTARNHPDRAPRCWPSGDAIVANAPLTAPSVVATQIIVGMHSKPPATGGAQAVVE
jgi:hypothetical protein